MAKTPLTMTRRARRLRTESTDAERRLWNRLNRKQVGGWRFRRQHPIDEYVADFACVEARLVVEVDGGQHAESRKDELRDQRMREIGWRVLRFWNSDVLSNTDGVVSVIATELGPHPSPPPAKPGEGTR